MTGFVPSKKHLFPNSPAFPASAARRLFPAKAQSTPRSLSPTTPNPLLIRGGEPGLLTLPKEGPGGGGLILAPVLCFLRHSRFVPRFFKATNPVSRQGAKNAKDAKSHHPPTPPHPRRGARTRAGMTYCRWRKNQRSHERSLEGPDHASSHPMVAYHIKHSLSSSFLVVSQFENSRIEIGR
jgi:hypothetical protein